MEVLAAGLAGGWIEMRELDGGADDAGVGQTGGEHSVDEVREGRNAVHEDPESGERFGTGEDAVERRMPG